MYIIFKHNGKFFLGETGMPVPPTAKTLNVTLPSASASPVTTFNIPTNKILYIFSDSEDVETSGNVKDGESTGKVEEDDQRKPITELLNFLELIASYYDIANDKFRAKSFHTAVDNLNTHFKSVTAVNAFLAKGANSIKSVKGIGKSILETIDDFVKTGTSPRLQELEQKYSSDQKVSLDLFKTIYGIGDVKAKKLYEAGYRTLNDLSNDTLGLLTSAQKGYLRWHLDLKERIPRAEMDIINEKLHTLLDPADITFVIAGSYRRGENTSGDVDILVRSNGGSGLLPKKKTVHQILTLLQELSLIYTLAEGPTKYMGIMRLSPKDKARRIDIRLVNSVEWPFALLYFTGSAQFNIKCRLRALELGYETLNEYGLYDKEGNAMPAENERDIFNLLELDYLSPEER